MGSICNARVTPASNRHTSDACMMMTTASAHLLTHSYQSIDPIHPSTTGSLWLVGSSRRSRSSRRPNGEADGIAASCRRAHQQRINSTTAISMADSAAELQAAASLFGSVCVDANLAFYEQKKKDPHPLACEEASKNVKACWESL